MYHSPPRMATIFSPGLPRRVESAPVAHRVALLVSGASGMLLPLRLLRRLALREDVERIHLTVSAGGSQVLRHELDLPRPGARALVEAAQLGEREEKVIVHRDNELDAPIASGSYRLAGAVVVPCSSSTVASLAAGVATTLVQRAGAVALKEGWPLILGFRETPLTVMHLENLRRLAWAGATVMPPIPAFYVGGEDLGRFADAWAVRVLDRLGLEVPDADDLRWG